MIAAHLGVPMRTLVTTLVLAALIGGSLWLTARGRALDEEKAEAAALLQRVRAASALSTAKTGADIGKVRETLRGDFLDGEQDAVVLADLQGRLSGLIEGQGCQLVSVSVLTAPEGSATNARGLKIQARGPFRGMHRVLRLIESGTPLLFITRADLRLEEMTTVPNTASAEPVLFADFDVVGYRLPPQEQKQGAAVPPEGRP